MSTVESYLLQALAKATHRLQSAVEHQSLVCAEVSDAIRELALVTAQLQQVQSGQAAETPRELATA